MSYVASIDSVGNYTTNSTTGSTSVSIANSTMNSTSVTVGISSIINMLAGGLVIPVGINTTIIPGNYWLAQAWNTASTTAGTTVASADFWAQSSQMGIFGIASQTNRIWGQTVSTSGSQYMPGQGAYSSQNISPPSTAAFSDIRSIASNIIQYFNIINSTI
jgi:hypothetical protein